MGIQEQEQDKGAGLSNVWQELLNGQSANNASKPGEVTVPALQSDPWSELLQTKDVEVFDLQQIHLHMSDQDVEQLLQVMREHSSQNAQS